MKVDIYVCLQSLKILEKSTCGDLNKETRWNPISDHLGAPSEKYFFLLFSPCCAPRIFHKSFKSILQYSHTNRHKTTPLHQITQGIKDVTIIVHAPF